MHKWLKNALVYQVFVDRFNGFHDLKNTPDFLGGNIRGVIEKIDYLKNLGVDVIWLSPFYETCEYHGYHITNFRKVDSHFGTLEDLKELIYTARQKNMRVIADFVPNHCSVNHPWFQEARKDKKSRYYKWFTFNKWPDDYQSFMNFWEIPKLNLNHPDTRDYMIETADYWLSQGLSGFRIDHTIGPSLRFWKYFNKKIIQRYPDSVFIGEVWAHGINARDFKTIRIKHQLFRKCFGLSQEKLQMDYRGILSGVLDFYLTGLLIEAAKANANLSGNKILKEKIQKHLDKIPEDFILFTFLDNHDMDRFIRHCNGNIHILLEGFELLFSLGYPVVLYNGTENCIPNEISLGSGLPFADLNVRGPVDWNNLNHDFIEKFKQIREKYRKF